MSKIGVIGAGYVGLVSAACLAKLGHTVTCVEANEDKVRSIRNGRMPISEPHLKPLWEHYQRSGRLAITGDYAEALQAAEFIFLCVGTPSASDGRADISHVLTAARGIAAALPAEQWQIAEAGRPIVVIKSTAPVGTGDRLRALFRDILPVDASLPVVSNPEFLREGLGVADFLEPARIIIGSDDLSASTAVADLYTGIEAPFIFCDSRTAELIKYTSNAFLATKISFINEMAELAEAYGVDITQVSEAVGLDSRIGRAYFQAGLGWGGSCLPKDLAALTHMGAGRRVSSMLLTAVQEVNRRQPRLLIGKLRAALGPLDGLTVGVWGLTFKPDCDDIRESPSLALIQQLQEEGCTVRAYDPVAMATASAMLGDVVFSSDPYSAATGADAVVLATAWQEFADLDFQRVAALMRGNVVADARNCLDVADVTRADLVYVGVGQTVVSAAKAVSVQGGMA